MEAMEKEVVHQRKKKRAHVHEWDDGNWQEIRDLKMGNPPQRKWFLTTKLSILLGKVNCPKILYFVVICFLNRIKKLRNVVERMNLNKSKFMVTTAFILTCIGFICSSGLWEFNVSRKGLGLWEGERTIILSVTVIHTLPRNSFCHHGVNGCYRNRSIFVCIRTLESTVQSNI